MRIPYVVYINVLKVPLLVCSKHQQVLTTLLQTPGALPPPL